MVVGNGREHTLESVVDLSRDSGERVVVGDPNELLRIDGTYHDVSIVSFVDDNVTREECAEFDLLSQSLLCECRVARAENPILSEFIAELLFKRGLNINVREDAKSLVFECNDCCVDDFVEVTRHRVLYGISDSVHYPLESLNRVVSSGDCFLASIGKWTGFSNECSLRLRGDGSLHCSQHAVSDSDHAE